MQSAVAFTAENYQPVVADPLLEPWRWHIFSQLSGLNAQCLAEADDGTMWFGTANSVWSYDGFDWVRHSENDAPTIGNSICCSPDGSVFVASTREIRQFENGKWSRVFPPVDGTWNCQIRRLYRGRDGSIWAATSWGAMRFHGSAWALYTAPEMLDQLAREKAVFSRLVAMPQEIIDAPRTSSQPVVRYELDDICDDPAGRIWMATTSGEVLCLELPAIVDENAGESGRSTERWAIYNETDGIAVGRHPSILAADDNTVWIVYLSESEHVSTFDGVKWTTTLLADVGMTSDCLSPIQTSDGTVWLSGRYVIGACRNGRWTTYSKPDVPIPSAGNHLFQSSDGALWICSPSTEVARVDYQSARWKTLEDLNFYWESPEGVRWYLHRDGRIVANRGEEWTSYGPEDGALDAPVAIIGTSAGDLWAAGSHEQTAATARFDGTKWTRILHDQLSWGIDRRGVLESSDGSVWFAAAVDSRGPPEHLNGLLQYKDGNWIHHHQPATPTATRSPVHFPSFQGVPKFYSVGESRDGSIWTGRDVLIVKDSTGWKRVFENELQFGIIECMLSTQQRNLWIGSRQYGALRFDGRDWTQYQSSEGLRGHSVYSLEQTSDGTVWAATNRGFSRFDGHHWTTVALPQELNLSIESGSLKASASGGIWINHCPREWHLRAWPRMHSSEWKNRNFRTTHHDYRNRPPQTTIVASASKEIQYPGNLAVLWSGAAQWRSEDRSRLQFSYRIDEEPWSPFTPDEGHAFFTLPAGSHRLEVRARDNGFNVDPTPASFEFSVLPPVWRQGWFLGMLVAFVGLIGAQTYRVVHERSRLRRVNAALGVEVEERKHAESDLRESEGRLRALFEVIPDLIFRLDSDGVFVDAKADPQDDLLAPPRDFLGKTFRNFVPPHVAELYEQASRRAQITSQVEAFEYQLDLPDGRRQNYEARVIHGADGGNVLVVRNVTQRVQAAEAIEQSEKKLAAIAATMPQTLYVFDVVEQKVIYANREPWLDLGYAAEDVARMGGDFVNQLLHPDDRRRMPALLARWENVRDGEVLETEYRMRHASGQWRWFLGRETIHLRSDDGKVREIIGTARDMTDRKLAEQLLRSHNRVLEQMASRVPLNLILETVARAIEGQIYDAKCSILLLEGNRLRHGAAPSLSQTYNDSIDGLEIGPGVGSCGTAAYEVRQVIAADTLTDPNWAPYQDVVQRFNIRACWSQPIVGERNVVLGTFALYYSEPRSPSPDEVALLDQFSFLAKLAIERSRDEQTLRQREAELAHVGRLSMLGETVAEIAHEVNQPLFSINNYSQACLRELAKTDGVRRDDVVNWLENIRASSARASDVLRRITAFIRSDQRERVPCSVRELIDDTLALISLTFAFEGIAIDVQLSPTVLTVEVDRIQIQQVLMNLLVNACDAIIQSGGKSGGRILIRTTDQGDVVEIIVEDNGPGVADDVRQQLFEPFVTTKAEGMGMGLAISRSILESHGGTISIGESQLGGAAFRVKLPKRALGHAM